MYTAVPERSLGTHRERTFDKAANRWKGAAAANAYNANKSQGNLNALIAALTKVQSDVQGVIATLPAGSVSPSIVAVIVAALGTAILTLSSIQALIPGAAPAVVTARAVAAVATGKVEPPNAATLKSSFNAVLGLHGYQKFQLQ